MGTAASLRLSHNDRQVLDEEEPLCRSTVVLYQKDVCILMASPFAINLGTLMFWEWFLFLCMDDHSSFIHNSPKLEIPQMY